MAKENVRVSIVIPAHNEADYIARVLTAAAAQNLDKDRYEVIVVANACTDETETIAQACCDAHTGVQMRVVREDRPGVLWAREAGRQAARGDVIAQLDADCVPDPDWLARGLKFLNNSNVSSVSGPYWYYDWSRWFTYVSWVCQVVGFWPVHQLLRPTGRGCIGMGGNMFIRASALEKIGGYDTSIQFYGEDTNTARRLMQTGHVLYSVRLYVPSSARRFKRMGVFAVMRAYTAYWVSELNFRGLLRWNLS